MTSRDHEPAPATGTEAPDLSEFTALNGVQGAACAVGIQMARMEAEGETDAVARLRAALAARTTDVQHAAIVRWFAKRQVEIRKNTVAAHRSGECSCKKRGLA